MYNTIRPGQPWLDTEGKRIQAHGGAVLFWEGAYYWYGENKEYSKGLDETWHWGVRFYRSTDLCNWEDLGVIIPPVPDDPTSPLHPTAKMDWPRILYNEKTKKFVCWLKIMEDDTHQSATILTADNLLGPYTIVKTGYRPLGMNCGCFHLVKAPDGKAYYYFERVHSEMICADLDEDYTGVTGYYSTHFPRPFPPYVREAPGYFFRRGKHYMISSGTTGYWPNPSEIAVADTFHGPFTVLGNPHPDDKSNTSFHSQIVSVFKAEGKTDLYIAVADRWIPDEMDKKYEDIEQLFVKHFDPDYDGPLDDDDFGSACAARNTSIAEYVWLPIRFDRDVPYIQWLDQWSPDDYE